MTVPRQAATAQSVSAGDRARVSSVPKRPPRVPDLQYDAAAPSLRTAIPSVFGRPQGTACAAPCLTLTSQFRAILPREGVERTAPTTALRNLAGSHSQKDVSP